MTTMEIALLVIGVIIFVLSFVLPDSKEKKSEIEIAAEREEVHRLVEQEIDGMKLRVNEATNDTVEYAVDKAERSLERVSNEKIMAVNEYAGTIIEEINKNHKEVMFLYDMLRDKQTDLTNAVREADAKVKEIENVSHTAQSASETLLRGMSVATVSRKGLTAEQKSVFDDIVIPEASPVVFDKKPATGQSDTTESGAKSKTSGKPRGVALAQAKIYAGLTNTPVPNFDQDEEQESTTDQAGKDTIVYDLLSGAAYREGNVVNVALPANGSVTAADIAALMSSADGLSDAKGNSRRAAGDAPVNNNDRIIALSKQGMDVVEIAKTLNLGVGEVKLVLDLFK